MKLPNFLGGTSRTGWEQLILSVLGTTISIALTFGTNTLVNNHKKKSDRRLAAVRVMSNIESYARQLDLAYESSTGVDSLASFLLTRMDDLKYLPEESIIDFTLSAAPKALVTYDSSAEQIFTSSFDVWRNVDNARFIDLAGQGFHTMDVFSEEFNGWTNSFISHFSTYQDEHQHEYANYKDFCLAYLHDPVTVRMLGEIHIYQDRLRYVAALLRWLNRQGMTLMNIPEDAVMQDVADSSEIDPGDPMPTQDLFDTPRPEV